MATPKKGKDVSPLESMFHIVPEGHDKAIKQAFYNTAATLFAVLVCGAAVAVFHILEVFLRPLLWAVLCGTFLHPFKHTLTFYVTNWLQGLRESGTPLIIGTAILPVKLLDRISESLSSILFRKFKLIICGTLAVPCLYIVYTFAPVRAIFNCMYFMFFIVYDGLGYFHAFWVWSVAVAYFGCVVFFWTDQTSSLLKRLSIPVWVLLLSHMASVTGPLRVPLLLAVLGFMLLGFISEIAEARRNQKGTDESATTLAAWRVWVSANLSFSPPPSVDNSVNEGYPQDTDADNSTTEPASKADTETQSVKQSTIERPDNLPVPSSSQPNIFQGTNSSSQQTNQNESESGDSPETTRKLSDQCFIVLLWAMVLSQIWVHFWLIKLLPILLTVLVIKKLGYIVVSFQFVREKCQSLVDKLSEDNRLDVIVPKPIRGLAKLILRGDGKIVAALEGSMDKFMSVLIILLLLVGTVCISFFMVVQMHRESMHLISVTSNVVNNSLPSEFNQWLPDNETMQTTIDSMVGNAYIYGREYIANKIHTLMDGQENEQLEQQLLEVYDQVYQKFIARNTSQLSDDPSDERKPALMRQLTMDHIDISNMSSLWKIAEHTQHFDLDIWSFVQENIGVVMSVLESVWLVLRSNLTLLGNVLTAMLSLVFGGGTAILNFIISAIIFMTTLFYLLAASGDCYLPVEWFSRFNPTPAGGSGNKFGTAVEEAIGSVFLASLKMAAFYGLYTHFTHTLFGIQMVYIPAALAATFAAIPFVGTYWACIPAVIELWLVNGEGVLAILLLVFHLLPSYIVDTAIYSDIKGGHPYLTGLAIAGGMYWMGLEGAIIGPVVLVCLIVAVNMYGSMLKPETPTATGR